MFKPLAALAVALTLSACAAGAPKSPSAADVRTTQANAPADTPYVGLTAVEAKARMDIEPMVIVDVRSAEAYQAEHIQGAINVPWTELTTKLDQLPKDKALLLYCTCPSEQTSGGAAKDLAGLGYTHLYVLVGGMQGWTAIGMPTTKTAS